MDGLSGIGNLPPGGTAPLVYGLASTGAAPTAPLQGQTSSNVAGATASAAQSVFSRSSTSTAANVESFIATYGPIVSSNEMLGALLLMLIMQYIKTGNDREKQDLLGLISVLARQQQGAGSGSTFVYQSSSLSIESTHIQAAASEVSAGAYTGATATLQQAPATDPGSAGLDVIV